MGIHAAKLAFGYLNLARKLGARVHTASPVIGCEWKSGAYHLSTPGGTVRARAVCIATAGYTSPDLHMLTRHRLMPILSNSIVTRPLTEEERTELNFKTRIPLTDTRTLRHYYRMMPDGRVQIGSRSAITGRDAVNPKHLDRLLEGLYRKFPILKGIRIDYSWWGWVDVSHDMLGGEIDPAEEAAVGLDALEAIGRFRVDVAFLGGGGLSPDGEVTDFTRNGAEQRSRMLPGR